MDDFETTQMRLRGLVETAANPPQTAPIGPLRNALRRLLIRAGRPRAVYQRQVDMALVAAFGGLGDDVREARRQRTELRRQLTELSEMGDGLADARQEIADLRGWLEQTSRRGDEVGGRIDWLVEEQQKLRDELERIARLAPTDGAYYFPHGLPLESFDAGLGGLVVGFRGARESQGGVYRRFEDFFRGSEEDIRERQRAYLPLLKGKTPVLDVGCGRGELLELLQEAGLDGHGIDIDESMVRRCREKGFAVDLADGVEYLNGVAPRSIGTIFAAQVIEHLSYEDLIALLELSLAKLVPGGRLIVETVNPHVPQALKNFWIDPTHRNPIFPETVVAMCRLVGFASGFIWYPQGSGDPDRDRAEQFDYCVVAEVSGPGLEVGASPVAR